MSEVARARLEMAQVSAITAQTQGVPATRLQEATKIALFGANQSGKTVQIGNLIRTFGAANVGIVSCEDGLKTVASLIEPQHVKECNSIADLRAAFDWAAKRYAGPDKWICVDGGTRAMQWIAGEVWSGSDDAYTAIASGKSRASLDATLRPFLRFITKDGDIDGQRQWIQIGRDIDREMNRWVKLPCNLYMTFWEQESSIDQYRKGPPMQVDCPGTAGRDAIYGTFDFILRLTRDGDKVIAKHDPTRKLIRSKTRDDWQGGVKVPTNIADFNLATFVTDVLKRPVNAALTQETTT